MRLPDVFARCHGAGMVDTAGMGLILIGCMFQAGLSLVTVKLALIIVFILFTSPVTTHALARAAIHGGVKPDLGGARPDETTGEEASDTDTGGDASSNT
jgi:multicomponent Na+:H+ antiporter subunit G